MEGLMAISEKALDEIDVTIPDPVEEVIRVAAPRTGRPRKGEAGPREKDIHREAFLYFLIMGPNRSREGVAKHFEVSEAVVNHWAASFEWEKRILALEAKNPRELFKDLLWRVLLIKAVAMFSTTGAKRQIALNEVESTPDKIHKLVSCSAVLERSEKEAAEVGKGGVFRGGVMVNFNIMKGDFGKSGASP